MNRVLIVDDDPASRRLLDVRLRPLECDVTTAANGEQALTAIRADQPDLVLLDLQMPRMGGMDVLRVLRQDGIEVPTIVITASDVSLTDRVPLHPEGWLEKPFRFDTLLELVKRYVLAESSGLLSDQASD